MAKVHSAHKKEFVDEDEEEGEDEDDADEDVEVDEEEGEEDEDEDDYDEEMTKKAEASLCQTLYVFQNASESALPAILNRNVTMEQIKTAEMRASAPRFRYLGRARYLRSSESSILKEKINAFARDYHAAELKTGFCLSMFYFLMCFGIAHKTRITQNVSFEKLCVELGKALLRDDSDKKDYVSSEKAIVDAIESGLIYTHLITKNMANEFESMLRSKVIYTDNDDGDGGGYGVVKFLRLFQ